MEIDYLLHELVAAPPQRYASMTHWPDTLTTDLVLRLADGRSESVGETGPLPVLGHGLADPGELPHRG